VMDWWLNLRENKNLAYEEFESTERKEDRGTKFVQSTELEIVLRYGPPDLEMLVVKDMDEEEAKELYNALFDDAADEPELQEIILAMMDMDDPKPSDVAEKLDIPVEDIYNRKKRLKRRLDKVMAALRKSLP
jgi:DNA-directed RNA polymerase specialized sigma24 family protein